MPTLLEIGFRHSRYYVEILGKANDLYKQGGEALASALHQYQVDHENIHKGQAWAVEHASRDGDVAALCMDYSGIAWSLLKSVMHPQEYIKWYEEGLVLAPDVNDLREEGNTLWKIAQTLKATGDCDGAIRNGEEALKIFREIEHPDVSDVERQMKDWRRN